MLVERHFAFLQRFFTPRTVFMHLGAGDCRLALKASGYVERVYAVGATDVVPNGLRMPSNLRLPAAPLCDGSVDIAFGNRVLLEDVYRSLAPGGIYFCSGKVRQMRVRLELAGFSAVKFYAGWLRVPYAAALVLQPLVEIRIAALK
jgi:hypothetical protein